MSLLQRNKKIVLDVSIDDKQIAKDVISHLNNESEEQILLCEADNIYHILQDKNFDKYQVNGILEIIKVLNELYGF